MAPISDRTRVISPAMCLISLITLQTLQRVHSNAALTCRAANNKNRAVLGVISDIGNLSLDYHSDGANRVFVSIFSYIGFDNDM